MPPKNTKSSSSALCKNFQNAPTNPARILSADTPPHLVDFYQVPVENDIIAGVEWIYCLWTLLHRTAPPSYRAFKEFDSAARELYNLLTQSRSWDRCTTFKLIIRSHVRTKALHTIYDILECQGYLESTCPGFIDDIIQEIVTCNSDSVAFSADLRRRCKIAAPMLEHKMWALQKVVIKQHKDFNLKNHIRFLNYLYLCALTIALLCALLAFASSFLDMDHDSLFVCLLFLFLSFGSILAIRISSVVAQVDALNTDAFKLIWAVRDMAGLLTRIADSKGSPVSDVSHAKRFLEVFQASFLGGRTVLSGLRRWLQGLPDWSDRNFTAHYWNDRDHGNAEDDNVP